MGPYDVLEQIGKGAFGAAWIIQTRGNDSNPPRRFVLKKIPLARLSERQRHLSLQERQLVAALRHPYIVPYHRSWIERSHTVCIVMRHCDGGDLASAAWRARRRRERFPSRPFVDGSRSSSPRWRTSTPSASSTATSSAATSSSRPRPDSNPGRPTPPPTRPTRGGT